VNALLGTELMQDEMEKMLERLEMDVVTAPGLLYVTPPHVRLDLAEEVDFSEEIGRIYGYDNLNTTLHRDNVEAGCSRSWTLRGIVRDTLTGMGISEIQTYSFVSPSGVDRIGLPADSDKRRFVKLINPLGEENSVMRTTLLPNMLDVLSGNFNRSNADVKLFEIGNTFLDKGKDELPEERIALSVGAYGAWGFFELKGVIEGLLSRLGIAGAVFEPATDTGTYHPGRCARILLPASDIAERDADDEERFREIGFMGELHPDVRAAYDIGAEAWGAEIDLDTVVERADLMRYYTPLDRYPAVMRDVSLLTTEDVTVGTIEGIIAKTGGKLLERVQLFDVYRGAQIPPGMKSLSFSLTYRAADRTLTDEEVAKVHEKILSAIEESTGATLREV
jgi:phenylalanyl-tRNA synthetase beta chain